MSTSYLLFVLEVLIDFFFFNLQQARYLFVSSGSITHQQTNPVCCTLREPHLSHQAAQVSIMSYLKPSPEERSPKDNTSNITLTKNKSRAGNKPYSQGGFTGNTLLAPTSISQDIYTVSNFFLPTG